MFFSGLLFIEKVSKKIGDNRTASMGPRRLPFISSLLQILSKLLILKAIEMNLMGEKGLENQTKRRSRPVLERINFELKIFVTIINLILC
jgi:hypothetical protein